MKLESIKFAIAEWNEVNDLSNLAIELLNQGVSFRINPKVINCSPSQGNPKYIHAYPGVVEDKLCMFFINSAMDTPAAFDDKDYPITDYIYVSEVENMSENLCKKFLDTGSNSSKNIEQNEAINRIARWNLSKDSFVKNQINNTEGLFEAFIIPFQDLDPASDIFAIFALNPHYTDTPIADLIIWDDTQAQLLSNVGSEIADLVLPIPPFGPEEDKDKKNFHLLNLSF